MLQAIGWLATAVFSASYFFRSAATLRRIQASAACLWIAYGVTLRAWPVVAANVIVAIAALASAANASPARTEVPPSASS